MMHIVAIGTVVVLSVVFGMLFTLTPGRQKAGCCGACGEGRCDREGGEAPEADPRVPELHFSEGLGES